MPIGGRSKCLCSRVSEVRHYELVALAEQTHGDSPTSGKHQGGGGGGVAGKRELVGDGTYGRLTRSLRSTDSKKAMPHRSTQTTPFEPPHLTRRDSHVPMN